MHTLNMSSNTFLLPSTSVSPPFWRYPRSPTKFLNFAYLLLKIRAKNWFTLISFKFISKPGILSRPIYKLRKSAIMPTAKALHLQMNEALAQGDKDTLRQICTIELYQKLATTIDHRPQGQRTEWQLVQYNQKLVYPKLTDDKVAMLPLPSGNQLIRQVIVSIASTQRIARFDDKKGGAKIKGSQKTSEQLEHIVLSSIVNQKTWETGPWKIWGTLPESTYEMYLEEMETEKFMLENQKH